MGSNSYAQDKLPSEMLDPHTDKPGEAWCYLGKSTLVRKIFQYEYKRLADSYVKRGGRLLEIKAPAMLTAAERK